MRANSPPADPSPASAEPRDAAGDPEPPSLDEALFAVGAGVRALHAILDACTARTADALRGRQTREDLTRALAAIERHLATAERLAAGDDGPADLKRELADVRDQCDLVVALLRGFTRGTTDALRGDRIRDHVYHALVAIDGRLRAVEQLRAAGVPGQAGDPAASAARRLAKARSALTELRRVLYPIVTDRREHNISRGDHGRIFALLDLLRDELAALGE